MCTQAVDLSLSLSLSLSSEKTWFSLSLVCKDLNVFTNLSSHAADSLAPLLSYPISEGGNIRFRRKTVGGAGGGHALRGGGQQEADLEQPKVFSLPPTCVYVYICIYIYE
jgi:hypothetical protein